MKNQINKKKINYFIYNIMGLFRSDFDNERKVFGFSGNPNTYLNQVKHEQELEDEIAPIIENHARGREILNPSTDYVDVNKLYNIVEIELNEILKNKQEVQSTIAKLNQDHDIENFYKYGRIFLKENKIRNLSKDEFIILWDKFKQKINSISTINQPSTISEKNLKSLINMNLNTPKFESDSSSNSNPISESESESKPKPIYSMYEMRKGLEPVSESKTPQYGSMSEIKKRQEAQSKIKLTKAGLPDKRTIAGKAHTETMKKRFGPSVNTSNYKKKAGEGLPKNILKRRDIHNTFLKGSTKELYNPLMNQTRR